MRRDFFWQFVLPFLAVIGGVQPVSSEIEDNTINEDGSYSYRHSNDDIGGYYHSASGSPDNIVRGRYGSRNPATGQVDEVVYTAGPRGFRANGAKIHRKVDLAQFSVRPLGSPDDLLADPFDDPSYSFSFRTADQSRTENNDATGRVRGLYSYIDDVGERHSVRYAAGAGTGFEVVNAVPDNPSIVGYTAPLYKAHSKTRGKMSVQRGPNGTYKLIAAGPDHRRAENRTPDGLVRGTYSFLDDKGIQRTVEYIAGAGIGYRIVQNVIGPDTHVNPSVYGFRLTDSDFRLANDFGRGAGSTTVETGSGGRARGSNNRRVENEGAAASKDVNAEYDKKASSNHKTASGIVDNEVKGSAANRGGSGAESHTKSDRMSQAANMNRGSMRYGGSNSGQRRNEMPNNRNKERGSNFNTGNRNGIRPIANRNTLNTGDDMNTRNWEHDRDNFSSNDGTGYEAASSSSGSGSSYYAPSASNNYNFNDDSDTVGVVPPLVTPNRKILENERERDWAHHRRDSTVIKNVGQWYIGLPPGQSVRAHVQNIDILPVGGRRVQSPSEALRQDELDDMVASFYVDTRQKRGS